MKPLFAFLFGFCFSIFTYGQELAESDIPDLVNIIDQQIDLNATQKMELNKILTESLMEHQRIQRLQIVDVEKLALIEKNQNLTRNKLEVVLMPEQYTAYVAFLDGSETSHTTATNSNQNNNTLSNNNSNYTGSNSAIALAESLGFTSTNKTAFVMAYENQENTIKNILESGSFDESAGVNLLTTILITDFKIIDLGGKNTYETYFRMRQNGQLPNGGNANNQKVDINQVYTFYDLKEGLDLSDAQTETFIRLFLENEVTKKNIRTQHRGDGATISKKLKALEKETLVKLQQFLSDEQLQTLVQIIGG